MNAAEKLSREVARVTTLRENYIEAARQFPDRKLGIATAVAFMKDALENAHLAAGSNDAEFVIEALGVLGDYTE